MKSQFEDNQLKLTFEQSLKILFLCFVLSEKKKKKKKFSTEKKIETKKKANEKSVEQANTFNKVAP
jgi:hypothetical protein